MQSTCLFALVLSVSTASPHSHDLSLFIIQLVPSQLAELATLISLKLAHNELAAWPVNMTLPALRRLDLSHNRLVACLGMVGGRLVTPVIGLPPCLGRWSSFACWRGSISTTTNLSAHCHFCHRHACMRTRSSILSMHACIVTMVVQVCSFGPGSAPPPASAQTRPQPATDAAWRVRRLRWTATAAADCGR